MWEELALHVLSEIGRGHWVDGEILRRAFSGTSPPDNLFHDRLLDAYRERRPSDTLNEAP